MKKICIIQPLLADYRLKVFEEIAENSDLSLIISESDNKYGYGKQNIPELSNINFKVVKTIKPFGDTFGMYQKDIIKFLYINKPDAVMIFSNPRYLSFWTTLIFCSLFGIKIFPHGHGIFKKNKISFGIKLMYKLIFTFSTQYICYCNYVAKSFSKLNVDSEKLAVVENSLINASPYPNRHQTNIKNRILFIGRVRENSKIELLIEALKKLRATHGIILSLDVIGKGSEFSKLELNSKSIPWITLHGEIYDQENIKKIANNCDIGVYPGDAGLSVVHYMSLGLPSVVHNNYRHHFGPEPTYIKDGFNGVNFSRDNLETFIEAIKRIYEKPNLLKEMQFSSYKSYIKLTKPSQAQRFLEVLNSS